MFFVFFPLNISENEPEATLPTFDTENPLPL